MFVTLELIPHFWGVGNNFVEGALNYFGTEDKKSSEDKTQQLKFECFDFFKLTYKCWKSRRHWNVIVKLIIVNIRES